MNYFKNAKTIEELKKTYRKLALENHPDHNGDEEIMKVINNEYDILFNKLKDIHNADPKNSSKKVTEMPEDTREILEKIIAFTGIEIEICGTWIWVTGKTYQYKDEFRKLGFDWSKNKKAWYWKKEETKKTYSRYNMEKIRSVYGSEKIENKKVEKIA